MHKTFGEKVKLIVSNFQENSDNFQMKLQDPTRNPNDKVSLIEIDFKYFSKEKKIVTKLHILQLVLPTLPT